MFAMGPYSRPRLSFWAPHSRSEWRCRDGAKRGEEGLVDGWREVSREKAAQRTEGGKGEIMMETSLGRAGPSVTPNALSENATLLWEASVENIRWRNPKGVNNGEEESVMKHIPGVISLGGEEKNFN